MDAAVNESIGVQMLQKVKILEALTEKQLQTVARCLVSKKYLEGEVIIKQGDVGDCFYLIADGEVSVQVNHITVATLGGGSFFGEMSLLSNERRSATVCAVKETTLLVLSRADFQEHLGTLEEVNEEARRRKEAATRYAFVCCCVHLCVVHCSEDLVLVFLSCVVSICAVMGYTCFVCFLFAVYS